MPDIIWITFTLLFSAFSFVPLLDSKAWYFRVFDFIRIQITALLLILFVIGVVTIDIESFTDFVPFLIILISVGYQFSVIMPYISFQNKKSEASNTTIATISINVKQDNRQFDRLLELVDGQNPDILLTIETDHMWEQALSALEKKYTHCIRIPQGNTYGMHLYTNLPLVDHHVHYLISEEHPSVQLTLKDRNNRSFVFWGIHPPPPSPTEKPTSKQKDAELLKLAKICSEEKLPIIVTGDFNNVTWSRTSKLFSKVSQLTDARVNRGIISTFPSHFRWLGFPIDLLFHSASITIKTLKTLPPIGSDHLPLYFTFSLNNRPAESPDLKPELKQHVAEVIQEGKEAAKEEN